MFFCLGLGGVVGVEGLIELGYTVGDIDFMVFVVGVVYGFIFAVYILIARSFFFRVFLFVGSYLVIRSVYRLV